MTKIARYFSLFILVCTLFSSIAFAQNPMLRLSGARNTSGSSADESVIYFTAGATTGFDNMFDAIKVFNNDPNIPNMYTICSTGQNLSINAMPPLGSQEVVIPLRYLVDINGSYHIEAILISNFPAGMSIYLEDSLLNTMQDLTLNPLYNFTSTTSASPDRFWLRFSTCSGDTSYQNASFCEGASYSFFGSNLTTAGTYHHTLTSVLSGCDSTIELNLTMNPVDTVIAQASICQGGSYYFHGSTYFVAATYYHTLTSVVSSCDSVVQLNLSVNPIDTSILNDHFCEGQTYSFFGSNLSSAGTYFHTLQSALNGCDSIIELHLVEFPVDTSIVNASFCEGSNYTFFGNNISAPGTYYNTLTSVVSGCDSIIRLELIMHNVDTNAFNAIICQGSTYDFYGNTLSNPGVYYHNLTSVVTGCDSVMRLYLIQNPSQLVNQTEYICSGSSYSWPVNGQTYNNAGLYYDTLTSVLSGCDSIMELELILNPSYNFISYDTICDGDSLFWRGNWYSSTGSYNENFTTVTNGCDSNYALSLYVGQLAQIFAVTGGGSYPVGGVGVPVGLSNSEIGISYYLIINGTDTIAWMAGTGSALDFGNQTLAGTYTVWAESAIGCNSLMSDSAVVTIITSLHEDMMNEFSVYPNPSNGVLNIEGAFIQSVRLHDLNGKCVFNEEVMSETKRLYLGNLPKAAYILKIVTETKTISRMIYLK